MKTMEFPFQAIAKLSFEPKPQPVPANVRPVFRIALIVLVLQLNCRNSTASLFKLQFFNWLLKNAALRDSTEAQLQGQTIFSLAYIHLDPMVNLALKYALADQLVCLTSGVKYQLTPKGHDFANRILRDDPTVLADERLVLERIGQRISEVKLRGQLI